MLGAVTPLRVLTTVPMVHHGRRANVVPLIQSGLLKTE